MYIHILLFYIICLLKYFCIKIFVCLKQNLPYFESLREQKPFWQLSRLDDFTINAIVNFFIYERLKISEAYSELSRASNMELFAKIS